MNPLTYLSTHTDERYICRLHGWVYLKSKIPDGTTGRGEEISIQIILKCRRFCLTKSELFFEIKIFN